MAETELKLESDNPAVKSPSACTIDEFFDAEDENGNLSSSGLVMKCIANISHDLRHYQLLMKKRLTK